MDFFEEEAQDKEEKTIFIERYNKQTKLIKSVMCTIFGCLGVFFLVAGIVVLFAGGGLAVYLPFLIIGGVYVIVTIILFLTLGHLNAEKAYERYKSRINNHKMIYNTSESSMRIIMLENRVKRLEEEIESLKKNR